MRVPPSAVWRRRTREGGTRLAIPPSMTRLVVRSALFALVAACSGSKHADESTPPAPAVTPANGSSQTGDDAAAVPPPPTEGSQPSDIPHGTTEHVADDQRVAQAPPDAGVRAPMRDAGAPGTPRDAASGADAGTP